MKNIHSKKLDKIALEMLSNSYFFKYQNPILNCIEVLGNCRVSAVLINEDSSPELLLNFQDSSSFYHMEDLHISLLLDSTG